jgi:hypothetical protein
MRRARPCAGHPRFTTCALKDVDGRDKPGYGDLCLYRRPDLATTFAQPDSRGTSPAMTIAFAEKAEGDAAAMRSPDRIRRAAVVHLGCDRPPAAGTQHRRRGRAQVDNSADPPRMMFPPCYGPSCRPLMRVVGWCAIARLWGNRSVCRVRRSGAFRACHRRLRGPAAPGQRWRRGDGAVALLAPRSLSAARAAAVTRRARRSAASTGCQSAASAGLKARTA